MKKCNHMRVGKAPCNACKPLVVDLDKYTECTRCGSEIAVIEGEETDELCEECGDIEDAADRAEMQHDIDCARGVK